MAARHQTLKLVCRNLGIWQGGAVTAAAEREEEEAIVTLDVLTR